MKIVYMGTPLFAVAPLKRLTEDKTAEVVAVVTNRDKPVGRKKVLTAPPVKVYAQENGIPVFQYDKIRAEGLDDLKKLKPDMIITCAFGQILSQEIIDVPTYGVYNIHASLLPKYRGASPIQYAILNGEAETGITIMKTDVGIDTGDIVLQKKLPIEACDTANELSEKLSELGADCIEEFIKLFSENKVAFKKQDDTLASYCKMIKKEDALIDWNDTAENVVNKIRAFNPAPVCYTFYNGEMLKVFSAKVVSISGQAGKVLECNRTLIIGCGENAVEILSVQKAGGKQMPISAFLLGNKIDADLFGK